MALKDTVLVEGFFGIYLAKPTKGDRIPNDRRLITDNEIIGMFEHLLKKRCIAGECSSIVFTKADGDDIFEVSTKGSLSRDICAEVYKNRK
ncbi:MAG: hypothetical protein RR346_03810 [Bacteroidales bacterium]